MNLVANKKILLVAVVIAFLVVIAFVVGSTIVRNNQARNTVTSSSQSTSVASSTNFTDGTTTNSAIVDLNLTDPTIKLPTVTLSSDPINSLDSVSSLTSVVTLTSLISSSLSSISNDLKSPVNLYVTNKDYKIWTVVWTTRTPTIGKLKYGVNSNSLDKVYSDDRSALSNKASYTHQVTITNPDSVLNSGNPTFYYKILSDEIEYGDGSAPYRYANAPLLSSPSSPVNAVVNLSKSISSNDAVILARIKSGIEYSEWVSSVLSGTNAILNIGVARKADLKSYMPPASPSKLEVSVLGPNGKVIGSKNDISLANIEDAVITITVTPVTSSVSSISNVISTISSSRSSIVPVATSSISSSRISSQTSSIENILTEDSVSSIGTVPATAIEDDLTLLGILIVSLVILIGGTSSLYKINSKTSFGRKVLGEND